MSLLDTKTKNQPTMPTTINNGTKITGDIVSDGDIRIDGILNGNVFSKAKVVVGVSGIVEGNIECQSADISGKITGKLIVTDLLFLKGAGSISGDISMAKLVVENGALFNGSCEMHSNAKDKTATPLSKVV